MKIKGVVDGQNRLDRALYRNHRGWLDRGKTGDGRLSLHGHPIAGVIAEALRLEGSEFVGCALSGSNFSFAFLDDAQFRLCDLTNASFRQGSLKGASFRACNASGADFRLNNFEGASFADCICTGAGANRSHLSGVTLTGSNFERAVFRDAVLTGATVRKCDFRGADFSRVKQNLDLAWVRDTVFEDCDLRGANFDGLRLSGARFSRCRVHGITGTPVLEGDVVFEDADASQAGDRSISMSQAELLLRWA